MIEVGRLDPLAQIVSQDTDLLSVTVVGERLDCASHVR